MRCKEKYVGDCPHRKQKETKPYGKTFYRWLFLPSRDGRAECWQPPCDHEDAGVRMKSQYTEKGRAEVWKDPASVMTSHCCYASPELSGLQIPCSMWDKKVFLKPKTELVRGSVIAAECIPIAISVFPFRVGSDWVSHFLGRKSTNTVASHNDGPGIS